MKTLKKNWIKEVSETSFAMKIPEGLFTKAPRTIAHGLKKAVLESDSTKGTKFQSAMSMLNFYINRAGKKLTPEIGNAWRKRKLSCAKYLINFKSYQMIYAILELHISIMIACPAIVTRY